MSQHRPDAAPPRMSLVTLGQEGHGRTTLLAALTRVLAKTGGATALTYEELHVLPEERDGFTRPIAHVEYETRYRRYVHADCPGHDDCMKGLLSGEVRADGALLLVSAAAGPTSQTREQLQIAHHLGLSVLGIFLNQADLQKDAELHGLVAREVREVLTAQGFPGDRIPLVVGSARAALEGDASTWGEPALLALLEAVERGAFPSPPRLTDLPFKLEVEDVFSHRGTVITGRVERGIIRVGEEVEVVGLGPPRKTVVEALEKFRQPDLNEARAGDNIGVWLRGFEREDFKRGQVLARPGSLHAHTRFKALLHWYIRGRSGWELRTTAPPSRFQFNAHGVSGTVTRTDTGERLNPNTSPFILDIELSAPMALEKGQRLGLFEQRDKGMGIVTELLD